MFFYFFTLNTDTSLFCHRHIPTIHTGYCVTNSVDYAKKNDVLPTISSTFSLELTYDHPNGFTYLQLGRDFINLFLFKYMAF